MFGKSKEIMPPLTYFHISFNATKMREWLTSRRGIAPESKWGRDDEVVQYEITMLPHDPFVFYHSKVNAFSSGIGGISSIDGVGSIEWSWNQSIFYVLISDDRECVFGAPLNDIFYLLKNGRASSDNIRADMDGRGIGITGLSEHVNAVFRTNLMSSGLSFSNELVRLAITPVGPDNMVQY